MPRPPVSVKRTTKLGLTSFKGMNFPSVEWIAFDPTTLASQLAICKQAGIKYIRLWIFFELLFNANADTVGFTAFNATFLTNLDTFINTLLPAAGIKAYINISDGNNTTKWAWTSAGSSFKASYITAFETIIARYANNVNVWGWDFFNEPLVKWGSNSTRSDVIAFCTTIYNYGKANSGNHYYTIGARSPQGDFDFDVCCDFCDFHQYNFEPTDFYWATLSPLTTQPIIMGECGDPVINAGNRAAVRNFLVRAALEGVYCVFPWKIDYLVSGTGANVVRSGKTLDMIQEEIHEPSAGVINF